MTSCVSGRAGARVTPAFELAGSPTDRRVRVAGCVIVRQRPGTAKGFIPLVLQDETGLANAVIGSGPVERYRDAAHRAPVLLVEGSLQREDGVVHVRREHFREPSFASVLDTPSVKSRGFR